ncbi:MAG: Photosystem I assembly protein Ycf3 [Syntrophus sp. SKADARSKE-3]|nr:Photosystem I assembly protein Ycf3 [Syntrophus sp. SKADARSKE-3]
MMKYLNIVLLLLLVPMISFAETRTIISEGSYNMGDGETPSVAESRALLNAKRTALEQAGTYVQSYSKTRNYQLTEDEVKVIASGLMQAKILDKKRTIVGDGFRFWVKIQAMVNAEKMENMAAQVKEKSIIEDYKKVQGEYEKSRKEIATLKKQLLATRNETEKKKIETMIESDERAFRANEWFEKGSIYNLNHEHDQAIEAYTNAIALNPNYLEAYERRGIAYYNKGLLQNDKLLIDRAVEDFKRIALTKPNTLAGAWAQGVIDFSRNQYANALASFNKAVSYDPESDLGYIGLGVTYASMKQFDRALEEYTRAIAAKGFWQAISYQNRAIAYVHKGQYNMAIKDLDQAIALAPNNAQFYYLRGLAYTLVKDTGKAGTDYDKACKMGSKNGCDRLLGQMAVEKILGSYFITGEDGVISQYSTRMTFEMKDGNLTARSPAFSVAGITAVYSYSDVLIKENVLTLKFRSQVGEFWSVSDMSADLSGGTTKIPVRWKQVSGNAGTIGKVSSGFLIRAERN